MPIGKRVNAETGEPTMDVVPGSLKSSNTAKKKLGQHFLNDRDAVQTIVAALGKITERTVIEIGPGRGVLTEPLSQQAGYLIAIELDRVLAAQLRMQYSRQPNVEIIEGDVLKMDFETMLGPRPGMLTDRSPHATTTQARVVGNIPYYITSDILLRLFQYHRLFDEIVIMIQKEVADRLLAQPGNSEYGLLSATAQLYSKIEKIAVLPPGAFSPPPKVDSTVLRLTMFSQIAELDVDEQGFIQYLKQSFAQKRKTLLNNLKVQYGDKQIRAALKDSGVRADVRAEALLLSKAAEIYRALHAHST